MNTAKLDGIRTKLAAVFADIDRVQRAPLPVEEAVEIALASFDRIAAKSAARGILNELIYQHNPDNERFEIDNEFFRQVPGLQVQLLALAIGREQIARNFHAIIAEHAATQPAPIPAAERLPKLKPLWAKQRELEIAEEAAILELEAIGDTFIPRRDEANPAVILAAWLQHLPSAHA